MKQAFKMDEIVNINILNFNELSIKNIWSSFTQNITVKQYIPDYKVGQYPEKDFFFGILSTLYPHQIEDLLNSAYKARKIHYNRHETELIELTPDIRQAIKSAIVYDSKFWSC